MTRLIRKLMPDGLAGRFTLLLVCALLVANLMAFALLSFERDRIGREARVDREIERIVGLVPALEAVAPHRRRSIARNASTRIARVRVGPDPLVGATRAESQSRALAGRLSESLAPREVRVGISDRGRWRERRGGQGTHEIIAVSIALSVEGPRGRPLWLNVTTRGAHRGPPAFRVDVFFLVLGLSLIAVLGVGLLFVRRLTRPLISLADAAHAAGRGDRSVRVSESGAREMRAAATAFNAMQGQIAGFEAERMRTLAAVGHDLRTPITSLRIRAEMLDDDTREPMVRTLDEMTVMADELVAYARGGEDAEERQTVVLSTLLARLCDERGATLTVTQEAGVTARPVALMRAIGNLIDNAIRYGGAARVTLAQQGGEAVVTVDDDGPGIAPERLKDMFEPFVRGEASRNVETGGAGLGLSIAQQIIRAHGGTIDLANRAEHGLRATVRLPL